MKRREAIRYLFITGSAVWLFPACGSSSENASQVLSISELDLVTDIAETVIPSTGTPGAKELGIQHFIHKMISDCRSAAYQKDFIAGLHAFKDHIKKNTGNNWAALTTEDRQRALNGIVLKNGGNKTVQNCVKEIRELTINGYKSSEYYLKIQDYKLVPGHFYGCVKVKKNIV